VKAGVRFPAGVGFFIFCIASRPAAGTTKPHIPMDMVGDFRGVKRLIREANHSPEASAEVKNDDAMTPLPHTSS
jgi:hypothetical protein